MTGNCIGDKVTTCEIQAWCPTETDAMPLLVFVFNFCYKHNFELFKLKP